VTPGGRRATLALAVPGALPLGAALALVPVVEQAQAPPAVIGLGVLGLLLLGAGLALPWPRALPWALGLLGVEYLVSLVVRGAGPDLAAPAYAAGYFVCAELAWLGLEARGGGALWPARALAVGLLTLGGGVLGTGLLLAAALPVPGGPLVTGAGVVAAVGLAACLAWLARR
jgi:hypothetical protein